MATTRIIPMHKNKGKNIAQCLRDRTEYAKNPEKTDGGELVSSFACDPRTMEVVCCKGCFVRTSKYSMAASPSAAV